MTRLSFQRIARDANDRVALQIDAVVVAGWTGRDEAAMRHHIEELAAIGVPRPSSTPVFYRVAADLLTQASAISVLGPDTSGEVEPVVVAFADGLWLGLGSDHTDRKAETAGIALSKQLCAKPLAPTLWKLDEVEPHWDELSLRAYATIQGDRVLYQEGTLRAMRAPADLLARRPGGPALPPGTVMFCGTLGALGGIRPADRFEMELHDPRLGRTITHGYDIAVLPIVS